MNIIFIAGIIALTAGTVFSFLKKDFAEKAYFICIAASVVLCIFSFAVNDSLKSISLGAAFIAALSLAINIYAKKFGKKEGIKNTLLFISKALMIILIIEAVVFNFNSYHLWRGEYNKKDLNLSTASAQNFSKNQLGYTATGSGTFEFSDINERVGTILLDVNSNHYKVDYSIDFTDETAETYRCRSGLVKGSVVKGIESTKYIVCNFSGKVGKLKIHLSSENQTDIIQVFSAKINYDFPSECNYGRIAIFLLAALFVFLFKKSIALRSPISEKGVLLKRVTAVIIATAIIVSMTLSFTNVKGMSDFSMNTGNQMTKEMVDAFEKGKVELDAQPSQSLKDLKNPYDWGVRLEQNADCLWDHVYYNGKYYSYYGAGPVVLLFMPYHMFTGHYFPSAWAGIIFNSIGLLFIGLAFYVLIKKFFPDISIGIFTAALVTIFASCGVWYCTVNVNFYEIAQSSGFCFTAMGAYFMLASNVIGGGKIIKRNVLLSTLFLAIGVTCRPTTIIWCVVSIAFIIVGLLKLKNENTDKKQIIIYLAAALIPFIIIGGAQMYYNYARFGSFTDFGIDYSITINDFTKTEFHTQAAAVGFFDYIFALPSFTGQFPYFTSTVSNLNINGYYYVMTMNGCGILFRALPTLAIFVSPFALKYVDKKKRVTTAILFTLCAVVVPFVVIESIWESFYGVRYMMDFAWEMTACAFMVIFLLYRNLKSEEAKHLYRAFIVISMFLAIVVNTALVFSYYYPSPYLNNHEADFVGFARMFSIFKTW